MSSSSMATLDSLKEALRQKATAMESSSKPLSDTQYSAGFDLLVRGSGRMAYQDFIIPQLSEHLETFSSHTSISVLEIGPGPKSVLGFLPVHLRRKIGTYTAFEPNHLFADNLSKYLWPLSEEPPLACLRAPPSIRRMPFALDTETASQKYDVILFCHSMYGMNPKRKFIEKALEMLPEWSNGETVVVFHRDGLHIDIGLAYQAASFPGVVRVANDDDSLDTFATFVAGFVTQNWDSDRDPRVEWRKVCRSLGQQEMASPEQLSFSAPEVMMVFTKHATTLPDLLAQVPSEVHTTVKNREARRHLPASIVRPTRVDHLQQCVRWALKHQARLTVIGGGHSGHCLWPNAVAVDMSAFDRVHLLNVNETDAGSDYGPLVIAEAGCKTGEIVRKTLAEGLAVPLGARPSVGAGLCLQGGIGHLARLHGLACDAIIGAVVISLESGQILVVGHVPSQHRPAGAVRPDNGSDLLWAIKGAGTNFGIVVSVTLKAYPARLFRTRNWIIPLSGSLEAQLRLAEFDHVAAHLPRSQSADAYLYWDAKLHLGVTMFESLTDTSHATPTQSEFSNKWGVEIESKVVDGVELFDAEMYVSGMHGGHAGKTSSFKRCLLLKNIGAITDQLVAAVEGRPTPLCYLHLLQGGGAVSDKSSDATAFGCRDWDFACVITGVWPRDQDGTEVARAAVCWVYHVARVLLPLSSGTYGADLGPDPRDAALAAKAFGLNGPRLARLKRSFDPGNVLAFACPLPRVINQKLIILVTGDHGVGKDYCADIWVSTLRHCVRGLTVKSVSISDATKREYAAATGTDLHRLLSDRGYKEQHRPALTAFFKSQVQRRPQLPQEHFLSVVRDANVDVLLITGMRDEAPVAALWHLVPESRLLDVRVRRGNRSNTDRTLENYRPSLIFDNDVDGRELAEEYAKQILLPFVHDDLQRLVNMVRSVADFPRQGIEFRHVLGISQQRGGLALCTSLLQAHFAGDWAKVAAVVCCEAGGFVFASALAHLVDIPLVLIREAGKLPPPTVSVLKPASHISAASDALEKRIEMERDAMPGGASVVVVDDVLATGRTLCAVLALLREAGISAKDISIMVVAEFPAHRGRKLLREHGFGGVSVQSLLVFGGA